MGPIASLSTPLLDFLYPERCAACGDGRGEVRWAERGARVKGLRPWDEPHLCARCEADLAAAAVCGVHGRIRRDDAQDLVVAAALPTHADLVRLVGAWKYHGMRGLAWPLSRLLGSVPASAGSVLVPVPLHGARRRTRGFNQAEVLARLLARRDGRRVQAQLLRRARSTGQQAKLGGPNERARNLAGAFECTRNAPDGAPPVELIDDLVTSGATTAAAAAALATRGWRVRRVLALGLATGPGTGPVASGGHCPGAQAG